MARYLARRVLGLVPSLVIASMVVFFVVFALPGDPLAAIGGPRSLPEATKTALRAKYHLADPMWKQYVHFALRLLHGDLGESLTTRRSVRSLLATAFPTTAAIAGLAAALELVVGICFGVVLTISRRRTVLAFFGPATTLLVAVPTFVLASLLQYVVAVRWRMLPVAGLDGGAGAYVLPAASLAAISIAFVARLTRARLREELLADYVRTARAKGLSSIGVLRHALRNALVVVITYVGLDLGTLLGGAIVTDIVFNLHGVGATVAHAISQRDSITIVGFTMVAISVFLVLNLAVDLACTLLDPRLSDR